MEFEIAHEFFPKSAVVPIHIEKVIGAFENKKNNIRSDNLDLSSNKVLECLELDLTNLDYIVSSKTTSGLLLQALKISGPEMQFKPDAYQVESKTMIEVEAGRACSSYQFLKDLFKAFILTEVDYLIIAVRQYYKGNEDYEKVKKYIEALYRTKKFIVPLKGILIIGY
jgi:hypothetical protein